VLLQLYHMTSIYLNSLRCVRLNIKRKYYYIIICKTLVSKTS